MIDITYECRILLNILDYLDEMYGFTLGKYKLVDFAKGNKVKFYGIADKSVSDLPYYGELSEHHKFYIENLIDFLEENNYIKRIDIKLHRVLSNHAENIEDTEFNNYTIENKAYVLTEQGINCLADKNYKVLADDSLYRKYKVVGKILEVDPKLVSELYKIYPNLDTCILFATYHIQSNPCIKHKYFLRKSTLTTDIINQLIQCVKDYLVTNTITDTELIINTDISKINCLYDTILANKDKITDACCIEDDTLQMGILVKNVLIYLGIYSFYSKSILYAIDEFKNIFVCIYANKLTASMQHTIIDALKSK